MPTSRQCGAVMLVTLILMLVIVAMSMGTAQYLMTNQRSQGTWDERQRTLAAANAAILQATADIATKLAAATSDTTVASAFADSTADTVADTGYYSSLATAPAWTNWPSTGRQSLTLDGITATYYVAYAGMASGSLPGPGSGLVGGNGGLAPSAPRHRFVIFARAAGQQDGVSVVLQSVNEQNLP